MQDRIVTTLAESKPTSAERPQGLRNSNRRGRKMATKAMGMQKWRAAPRKPAKLVDYVDNAELRRRGRAEILIENAEVMLDNSSPASRDDEQVLFRALHACGYALNHLERGRAAGRSSRQLKALHERIMAELVNRNMGLIYDMRRRTRVAGVDVDDLMSEGLWTLYRAVVSFDPWRGFRFSTYACTSILRGFLMLTRRRQRQLEQINRIGEGQLNLPQIGGGPDLQTQMRIDRLHTLLSDNRAGLTPTERFVIERRLMHDPGVKADTLESIGEMFELSKERIRQIQVSALGKLRGALLSAEADGADEGALDTDNILAGDLVGVGTGESWTLSESTRGFARGDLQVEFVTPVGDGPGAVRPSVGTRDGKTRKAG